MSWRASPSRPAPPLTSSLDPDHLSLFGSSSGRSPRPLRTSSGSSTPGTAAAHLARQMAEMDDDRMSIRSGKSGVTLNGNGGGSLFVGRSRKGSSATSISSARTARRSDGDSAVGSDHDELELTRTGNSVSESPRPDAIERPESRRDGTIPQVVKRQRVQSEIGPSRDSRLEARSTWFKKGGPPPSPSPSRPPTSLQSADADPTLFSLDVDPDPDTDDITPTVESTPTFPTSSAPKFIPTSAPTPSRIPAPSQPPPPAALRQADSTPMPTPRLPPLAVPTDSSRARRTSWFSRGSHPLPDASTLGASPAPPPPLAIPSAAATEPPQLPPPTLDISSDPPASIRSRTSSASSSHTAPPEQERPRTESQQQQGKGWRAMLSRSNNPSSADVRGLAEEGGFAGQEVPAAEGDGEVTPKTSEGGTGVDGEATLRAPVPPSGDVDDKTLTPRPTHRQATSLASQRTSWWGWGVSISEEVPVVPSPPPPEPEPEPEPVVEEPPPPPPVEAPPIIPPAPKSWLQTIWGETPEEAIVRKQREAAQAMMDQAAANAAAEAGEADSQPSSRAPSFDLPPSHSPATSGSEFSTASTTPPSSSAPVHPLKHTSSWSFFSPRASSTPANASNTTTPTTSTGVAPSTTVTTPTPPMATPTLERGAPAAGSKANSLLSKSPLLSLASSRTSRASSRSQDNSSAPNSPRLGPQADNAPLKPLTGSVRSSARPGASAPAYENLVLPTFDDTFHRAPRSFAPKKSKLTAAVSVVSSYLFSQPPAALVGKREEVPRMKDDPAERLPKSFETMGEVLVPVTRRVRRVVTIGVHGWFPTPMVRSVFGEPTGTSVKFSTMMHDAVQSYLEDHDVTSFNIQAIALEGEGQVEDRVDKLFDQLVGREAWVEALAKADVVFLATHSQGSVVSTTLLARMVERGLVSGPRTHMLAMCAIAQGPFVYLSQSYALSPYFNYVESAPARELFEFQDPDSIVAKRFLESLRIILQSGVKITVVGSINDQVVPLYSSLFAGISHPGIIRAVYIDSAAFRTSDFLANLVVFACRLRNAGLKDHDLVYHVSEALAGALTGVGHSKIYEEEEVFNLAVRYQLETTSLLDAPTHLDPLVLTPPLTMSFNPREARNPYLLTWALRGIIEDPQVRELFASELTALREAFETWKPTTKVLKDVKLKLEGIRMLPLRSGRAKDAKL